MPIIIIINDKDNNTIIILYKNGPGDWLLVDDHLVDLSGRQCNKVGVSYTGFKRQNSPCDKPEHS